jgi:hypothetical protein
LSSSHSNYECYLQQDYIFFIISKRLTDFMS